MAPARIGVYNSGMRLFLAFALCATLIAGEKKAPQGHEENDAVAISATVLSPEQVVQIFRTDFNHNFTVLEVTVTPKTGKPYPVRMDDFILRSESSLEHSGPMSAGEIAGSGEVVVTHTYGNRSNVDDQRPIEGTKLEMKDTAKGDEALADLKRKMLPEKSVTEPESGLLFFPLAKQKPKNLVLSYTSPAGHLRLSFK